MKRVLNLVLAVLALSLLTESAWSKGPIVKIVIEGGQLTQPLEITDSDSLDKFTIWSGPGVGGWDMATTIPPAGTPKFIADWTKGIATRPTCDSRLYQVRMFIGGREAPRDTYEVLYSVDANSNTGYVYLPNGREDGFGLWNTYQIARGVEGNWFQSTREWDDFVRPLLGID